MLSSVIAGYNRDLWPAQILAYALALLVVGRATGIGPASARPATGLGGAGRRLASLVLAAAWGWTGAVFHLRVFVAINFMAPVYGGLFLLQAVLFAASAVRRDPLVPGFRGDVAGAAGLGLGIYAVAGYPLIAATIGDGLASTRVVGLDPSPTAVFTLAVLLLAEGRAPLHLAVLPVLWSLLAGASAWLLMVPEDLPLPLFGLAALVLMLWTNRRTRRAAASNPLRRGVKSGFDAEQRG